MPAVIDKQAATGFALIHMACSSAEKDPNLHIGCLCIRAPGGDIVNHRVDAVVDRKPLLVRNEMSLVRQVIRLVDERRATMTTDLHEVCAIM